MATEDKTLDALKKQIAESLADQKQQRAEIKTAQNSLRELRDEQAKIREERAALVADIKTQRVKINQAKEIIASNDADSESKASAQDNIEEYKRHIDISRVGIADRELDIARLGTKVQKNLGSREHQEGLLSSSRTQQRDSTSRRNMVQAVDSLTPKELKNNLSQNIAPDTQLEALRAGSTVGRMGGSKGEQQQAQQASAEFSGLFVAVKEARKALLGLAEGTDEYKAKQEELTNAETKTLESLTKLTKIERDVEKRRLTQGDPGTSYGQRGASALIEAGKFGAGMLGSLGGLATDRYVLEEKKKQAQLQQKNMSVSDLRNSSTDATSFLSTGGGALFGAEMPYRRDGAPNEAAAKLGKDYGNTQRAEKQYGFAMDTIQGFGEATANVVGDASQAGGINPITGGPIAGAGSAMKNYGKFGLNTAMNFYKNPELAAGMGGEEAAGALRSANDTVIGGATELMQGVGGSLISQGGGNGDLAVQGIGRVGAAGNDVANGMVNLSHRGYKAVDERQSFVETEQTTAQQARIRERLSMAMAPSMQQYMDVQPTMKATMRSRSMDKSEREGYEKELEGFSVDKDLSSRGFGVNEILGNNANTAQRLGRFGSDGMNEKVSKTAMMGEAMGLGSASQGISAMGGMVSGGVKDPEALMTKAMKEGLQKGLQDSRQFGELLQATQTSADNAGSFEGAMDGLLKLVGSGRSTDVQTAKAAYAGIKKDTSGHAGDWTDMVKFDITNKAAKGVIATDKGQKLNRDDRTSLQSLHNLNIDDMKNVDLVKGRLTPDALEAVEAMPGGLEGFVKQRANEMAVSGLMDRSVNANQDAEYTKVRNLLKKGEAGKEELKKEFTKEDGSIDTRKIDKILAQTASGQSSEGDTDRGTGAAQGVANMLGESLGLDTQTMNLYQQKYKPKDAANALVESGAANTSGEQMDKTSAQISQTNMSTATDATRDQFGDNKFAKLQSNISDRYGEQNQALIKNVASTNTVAPEKEVARIDDAVKEIIKGLGELRDSLKGFSPEKMVINATGDLIVQGAAAIKGVMLDNGLTAAASKAGTVIAEAVKGAFGSQSSDSGVKSAPAATPRSVPNPSGPQ